MTTPRTGTIDLTFRNDLAEANIYASELQAELQELIELSEVQRKREDGRNQDFGASLVVLLASPAVVALAKALGNYLAARQGAKLVIKTSHPDGRASEIEISGQPTKRIQELLKEILAEEER